MQTILCRVLRTLQRCFATVTQGCGLRPYPWATFMRPLRGLRRRRRLLIVACFARSNLFLRRVTVGRARPHCNAASRQMVASNARIGEPDQSQISDLKFEIRDAELCGLCVSKQDLKRKKR